MKEAAPESSAVGMTAGEVAARWPSRGLPRMWQDRGMVRQALKLGLSSLYLDHVATELLALIRRARRQTLAATRSDTARVDHRLRKAYLRDHSVKKLHLGCGRNVLDGWLNTDLRPRSEGVLKLNALERFPFEDRQFDFIYTEHMIEHVPYDGGLAILHECYRVLRPGGRIRISTPDLVFVLGLYTPNKSPLQQRYIEWSTQRHLPTAPYPDDTFVINNFMRDWSHCFIYDEKTLRFSLERAKFTHITRCSIGESDSLHLRGLEHEARLPDGFLRLETLTLEGTRA